jgi:hypothetical protein
MLAAQTPFGIVSPVQRSTPLCLLRVLATLRGRRKKSPLNLDESKILKGWLSF